MDIGFKIGGNTSNYRKTLDRITEKYFKLSRQGGAVELNWGHETLRDVTRLMSEAELEMSRIEAESTLIGKEYSDGSTNNGSQIEFPAEETNYGYDINDSIVDGVSEVEQTQASGTDLMEDSQGDLMDGLMHRTLCGNDSTLMELYPEMIRKIGKARHRQQVSEAASSVLRRYRRMRQKDGNARKTTIHTPTAEGGNPPHSTSCVKQLKAEVESSPAVFHSPVRRHQNPPELLQGWRRVHNERPVDLVKSSEKPVLVMDFYSSKPPSPVSMNHTFTVSKGSPPCSPLIGKSQRRSSSPAMQCNAQTLRLNRSNLPHVTESSFVPSSPVRPQASFKTKRRDWDGHGGSRDTFSRHSKLASLEGYTRKAEQASFYPASPLHEHQPRSPRRALYHQDFHSPSRPRKDSPCGLRLRRHKSFDSSLRPGCVTRSPAKIEEEFTNLFHKYVCLGKSLLSDHFPCRCSVRSSEANRESPSSSAPALSALALSPSRSFTRSRSVPQKHSSISALSALALSPYRPAPRKRARELDQNRSPKSKRPREWLASPGSLRHSIESRRSLCFGSREPLSSTRLNILS